MKRLFNIIAVLAGTAVMAAEPAIKYRNALEAPFELSGFPWRGTKGELRRLPVELDGKVQQKEIGQNLAFHGAGGMVRFRTDSNVIMIRAVLHHTSIFTHMTIYGTAGFQLEADSGTASATLFSCCCPSPAALVKGASGGEVAMGGRYRLNSGGKMRNFTLYFPLYSGVKSLEIGIYENAGLAAPLPHKIRKPVLFYGSSITQGCSASGPGRHYAAMLCSAVDAPMVNMGFSSGAHGEPEVAQAIASLDLSAVVMDYDHNAPNVQELQQRHANFYRIIRQAHPDLPIVIMSGPRKPADKKAQEFRTEIKKTYEEARAAGDKNVWFVDGFQYFREVPWQYTTVDLTHPTDLGFYQMYCTILPVLRRALGISK